MDFRVDGLSAVVWSGRGRTTLSGSYYISVSVQNLRGWWRRCWKWTYGTTFMAYNDCPSCTG